MVKSVTQSFQPCKQILSLCPSPFGEYAFGTFKSLAPGQGLSMVMRTHAVSAHPLVSVTVTQ